jgi:hypothetical protein
MKKIIVMLSLAACIAGWSASAHAEGAAIAILKQGLLGAGTGAAASALTGAKGADVWKGALTGMGVNVVGGALLDMVTTPSGTQRTVYMQQYQQYPQQVVQQVPQQVYYQEVPQRAAMSRQAQRQRAREMMRRHAYQTNNNSDYLYGYQDGYQDGVNDARYGY